MTRKYNHSIVAAHAVALDLKASPSGRIEGYASTFGGPADRQGDVVLAGAFSASLARHRTAGEMPVMLWSHAQERPIGRWVHLEEDSTGLFVEGNLNLATTAGREAFEHVKAGDAGGLSIGFTVPEGGREYVGSGVFNLKQADVLEISVVTIAANPLARITGVKSLNSKADAIDMLRGCGLSKAAAARFAAGGFKALSGDNHHQNAIELASKIDAAIKQIRG